ncbi:MAG: hypothetical protein U0T81_00415 [Saprospiraceae bacterium]
MYRIRKFEEKTLMMYSQQKIRGFCHVYQANHRGRPHQRYPQRRRTGYSLPPAPIALSRGISRACMVSFMAKRPRLRQRQRRQYALSGAFFGGNGIVGAQTC